MMMTNIKGKSNSGRQPTTRIDNIKEDTKARNMDSRGPIYKISYDNLTIILR